MKKRGPYKFKTVAVKSLPRSGAGRGRPLHPATRAIMATLGTGRAVFIPAKMTTRDRIAGSSSTYSARGLVVRTRTAKGGCFAWVEKKVTRPRHVYRAFQLEEVKKLS